MMQEPHLWGAEFLRKPNLKCGNEKYGYRHIKLEHMDDWGNIATRVGGVLL